MKESWDDIVKNYPDMWVALSDCNMNGMDVVSAIVRVACVEDDRLEKEKELVSQNIPFIWKRTTDVEGAYVL